MKKIIIATSFLILAGCASATATSKSDTPTPVDVVPEVAVPEQSTTPPSSLTPDELKAKLMKSFTNLPSSAEVSETSIPGIYQILVGGQYVFTNATGDYLITGDIIKASDKTSLIKEDLAKKRGDVWGELPTALAFSKVYGKGERKVAVFFDPDCPYCKKMESDLNEADPEKLNLTVTYYLFPLPIHPDAARKADAIYCSTKKAETLDKWIMKGENPQQKAGKECISRVRDILEFGAKKYLSGTPTLVFPDNFVLASYLPMDNFLSVIAAHNVPVPVVAEKK